MKSISKILLLATIAATITIYSCKKEENTATPATSATPETFSSIIDFQNRYGQQPVAHTINGTTGGSFTTAQGTIVSVPPNAFVTAGSIPVTGNVIISFEDIYKKSDMLLSNKVTMTMWGTPLNSGGEFFMKATENGNAVTLASGKIITVEQPVALTGGIADTTMTAFTVADSMGLGLGAGAGQNADWVPQPFDTINFIGNGSYMYSFYQFQNPPQNGTWSNCDNPYPFSSLPQTNLTLHTADSTDNIELYLVFSNINSVIHIYQYSSNFIYPYAPVGLQCTAVAITTRNGNLFSSFTPITISNNMTVNFTLTQTTSSAFITQLNALN